MRWPRFWSNVLAVAYRETQIIRHDKPFLGVLVAQPVMMLMLFGLVLSNKPRNVPWAVLDRSDTTVSRRLVHDVQATALHCLGFDHTRLTYRHMWREFRLTDIAGNVVQKMLA